MLGTGEVLQVTNNDAHALIESGQAKLVSKLVSAQTFEPQPAELGQSSSQRGFRRRGKYLIK